MNSLFNQHPDKERKSGVKITADRVYLPLALELKKHLEAKQGIFGIYFKDLRTEKTFGINDSELFLQASCVKVPYVLYLYEKIAAGSYSLKQRLAYQPNTDYSTGSGYLQYIIKEGDRLTLRALAKVAITLSDNIAYKMIKRLVGPPNVVQFMKALGGTNPWPDGDNYTTPRDQGFYLSGVLDFAKRRPELGEMLLDDLAHPVWHCGLPALLPDETKVAHKEGDLEGVANDAGIIFAPDRPYILIVLSQNQPDVPAAFQEISVISKLVFDYQYQLQPDPGF
ncbi:MAG: class A beta-lactamase-related serine hydrolase [Bacillota bacterium]|nr:class A beta-lactamase-related serine hydrolase [Bacillota bacterium]